jgi:hypothetical protein
VDLVRLGNASLMKSEDNEYPVKEELRVTVMFRNFGHGDERTSDFRVDFTWPDVDKLIAEFAIMGDPSAISLNQAKSLSDAVNGLAGRPTKSI